jgi:hypothetical protein
MPRLTAWSTSTASSASAFRSAARARSIRSSSWEGGIRVTRFASPDGRAGPSCRRPGCARLIPGLDRRRALPTRPRMLARYDNPSCQPTPPVGWRWAPERACRLLECDLGHITPAEGSCRTVTDACGLLRTSATWPTRTAGVCIWRASAAQWVPEPGEGRRKVPGCMPRGIGMFKIAVPVWDVLIRGVSSPSTPPSPQASA